MTQDSIDSIVAQSNELFCAKYFVTKEKISDCDIEGKSLKYVLKATLSYWKCNSLKVPTHMYVHTDRRISEGDVRQALSQLDESSLQCYICGPPPMTEDILTTVTSQCGLDTDRVHYEKWW